MPFLQQKIQLHAKRAFIPPGKQINFSRYDIGLIESSSSGNNIKRLLPYFFAQIIIQKTENTKQRN
jgi:hypothetical protein